MNVRGDTKSRILDAAEKSFGLNGFDATSLRDITTEADVNLAAVNYHFHSKDSLIDAVIARRIEPVNQKRLELLDAAGPDPTLEQILAAFLTPVLNLPIEVAAPLMGRVLSSPDQFMDRVFYKHLAPISQRFLAALFKALPELPATELLWRWQFLVGAMTHTILWGQIIPKISGGVCDFSDRDALVVRAVTFVAAGFRAESSKGSY